MPSCKMCGFARRGAFRARNKTVWGATGRVPTNRPSPVVACPSRARTCRKFFCNASSLERPASEKAIHLAARILFPLGILGSLSASVAHAQWHVDGAGVCTAASNQFSPVIVADGTGGGILAWFDYRSGSTSDVYAHRILASGVRDPAWPIEGRALCTAIRNQQAPALIGDGQDGAIVAWQDYRGGMTSDVYAEHVLSSGAVDPLWPPDGPALTTASDHRTNPSIVSDGARGAIVVWTDYSGGPESDIRAQHVLSTGIVDGAWPTNGRVLCGASGNQSVPCIASDGSGGAVVAWSDLRGANSDIYAQHVLVSGTLDPSWLTNGSPVCTASGNQSGPSILSDGNGGFLIVWHDYRSGVDADIYAHRMLISGAKDSGWPAEGRQLCGAPGEQYATGLVGDGAGGAIAIWYDYRGGAEADVYVQHVTASGLVDPAWPVNGSAMCTAVGDQVTPTIVSDGSGGAIAAWHDFRNGEQSDVYSQHVTASGMMDPSWPPDGIALCLAPGDQYAPAIASGGPSGVLAAWADFRGGLYSDIYAQKIYGGGGVAGVDPQTLTILRPPRPNPTRGAVAFGFDLRAAREVTVDVLDLTGRRLRTLLASERLSAGRHEVDWVGRDDRGALQTNGIYFVRLAVAEGVRTWRVAMAR